MPYLATKVHPPELTQPENSSAPTKFLRRLLRWDPIDAGSSGARDEKAIVSLQWLVAIATSYLVLAVQDPRSPDPSAGLLIIVCLVSAVIVQRASPDVFVKAYIKPGLLLLDSFLVLSAIVLREQTPWDLLLLFFFCVFIAAIAENLMQVAVGSVLLSVVFLLFVSPNAKSDFTISPDLLVRVPFMFGISLFYGYVSGQLKQEKQQRERIEEEIRLRRQFVSALAHDIKTPLNVILGHAELLGGQYGGQKKCEDRLSSLRCIHQNIDRIVQLVTDFLAVSRLETVGLGTMIRPVQMNAVIEDVVAQQMVTAHDKKLTVSLDLHKNLKPVMGDHSQLQRALDNLVSNAIKFTPNGGSIGIRSRLAGDEVAVEVTDTGPGIPADELPRMFSQFKRLDESRNTEGTGLGLFIVKTIVEAHYGSVKVESQNGRGTTFTILIPVSKKRSMDGDSRLGGSPSERTSRENAPPQTGHRFYQPENHP